MTPPLEGGSLVSSSAASGPTPVVFIDADDHRPYGSVIRGNATEGVEIGERPKGHPN